MDSNKLIINQEKTVFSIFSPNKTRINISDLYYNDIVLKQVQSVKYLGVIIDDNLSWKDHIKSVCNNLIKYIGIFYKIRYKLPFYCLKNLYFSTVFPIILYGIEIYGNTFSSLTSMICLY